MISCTPTQEQQMLVDTVRRFANVDIRKIAHDADEEKKVPADVISRGWELGLLPGLIPESYGGYADEQPTITGVLALEELAWGDLSVALEIWTPALFALPVLCCGTDSQKQTYLPLFVDADRPIMTAGLIEPSITFDPWRPETTATATGEGYTLNGQKAYVPLAVDAQKFIIYAKDSESGKVDGYIVEKGAAGITIGEREKLMGIQALPTYSVGLSGVHIPLENRLGGETGTDFDAILSRSRIALGALAVGVARAALEYARDYAKERVQFRVPIATKQAIAFKIADMAIEVDAARMLVWEAAWRVDKGMPFKHEATLVKHYTSKMSLFVADSGVQTLGGYGYIREYPSERYLRNARGFSTFDGLAIV
nr:acyl-CoA dehydrogenase family protein [Anaerolineae bacterium]